MDFFSHFLIGILISIFTLNKLSFSIVLYAGVMSVLADFDIILEPLQLIKKSNLVIFIIFFINGILLQSLD